jgi:hypothetical protein
VKAAAGDTVLWLCRAYRLPLPETEARFDPVRKWRADYLWREAKVILEREGGIFRGGKGGGSAIGGHSSGVGILRDMEKSNAAQLAGYLYLRATPRQIQNAEILDTLRLALARQVMR